MVGWAWKSDNLRATLTYLHVTIFILQLILHYIGEMINALEIEKATRLLLDMIIVSERFDNELTSEKGVGKVFAKV